METTLASQSLATVHAVTTAPAQRTTGASRGKLWAGRIITGFVSLFLAFDGVIKLLKLGPVMEGTIKLGYPTSTVLGMGVVLLSCLALYLVPRTAVFGAVLLTGYLGGAIATHVRVGDPLFSHTLFPIYVAVMIWGGLYLRDSRVRAAIAARARA